jgi:hypothetical protein
MTAPQHVAACSCAIDRFGDVRHDEYCRRRQPAARSAHTYQLASHNPADCSERECSRCAAACSEEVYVDEDES